MQSLRAHLAVTRPWIAAVVAAPLVLSGCLSSENDLDLSTYVEETDPADQLYNEGLANLNAGRMNEAIKKFEAVDRQHPYSEFARKSMVMGAFTNYRQGKYEEAINASKRYVALYPSDEDAAYAQYIIGLSYYRQIRDVTQDQKEARRTVEAMEELVQRWPESQYVEAIKRFRVVVEFYSNTRHIEESLARLTEAYYAMGLTSEAQTAAAVLGNNYPDSQWYKDSYALLQGGGLEPRENTGSWLSKAGRLITGA